MAARQLAGGLGLFVGHLLKADMAVSILTFLNRPWRKAVEEVLRHTLALRLASLKNEELWEAHEAL